MSESVRSEAGGLPRLNGSEASGAWLATRVLGRIPRRLELTVGGFGSVTLSHEGVGAVDALGPDAVTFALARGREVGRLALDGALASRIIAVALGAGAEVAPALGRLGPAARGLVGGFVASVLHAVGAPLAVSLAPGGGAPRPVDTVAVAIRVDAAGGAGWAALEAPRSWLEDAVRLPPDPDELRALGVEAAIELSRTTLTGRELAGVTTGDAVVFDGEARLGPREPWLARLAVGDYAAEVVVAPEGGVTMTREFWRVRDGECRRVDGGGRGADAEAPRGRDTTLLAELPIEVVLELARVSLRGDELVGLAPGSVLPVGAVRGPGVVLRVAGEVWAEGELVDVEGELAVRVTRTTRAPRP